MDKLRNPPVVFFKKADFSAGCPQLSDGMTAAAVTAATASSTAAATAAAIAGRAVYACLVDKGCMCIVYIHTGI